MGEGLKTPCPKSLFFELMDFTCELSRSFNLSPFEILDQDTDNVIMLVNYFVEKGQDVTDEEITTAKKHTDGQPQRIRVNDKTATGGWF